MFSAFMASMSSWNVALLRSSFSQNFLDLSHVVDEVDINSVTSTANVAIKAVDKFSVYMLLLE